MVLWLVNSPQSPVSSNLCIGWYAHKMVPGLVKPKSNYREWLARSQDSVLNDIHGMQC
jgi:hypothetical protein